MYSHARRHVMCNTTPNSGAALRIILAHGGRDWACGYMPLARVEGLGFTGSSARGWQGLYWLRRDSFRVPLWAGLRGSAPRFVVGLACSGVPLGAGRGGSAPNSGHACVLRLSL